MRRPENIFRPKRAIDHGVSTRTKCVSGHVQSDHVGRTLRSCPKLGINLFSLRRLSYPSYYKLLHSGLQYAGGYRSVNDPVTM